MKNDSFNTLEREDIDICEDVELDIEEQGILAYLETWFDVDKKFGVNTRDYDDTWVNLNAIYNPVTDKLKLLVDLESDDKTQVSEYVPTNEEKELIKKAIDEACIKQTNMNAREFYIREYIEHEEDMNLVCEECEGGCRIRNVNDGFILYQEDKDDCMLNLIKYVGDEIEVASYAGGETISIESLTKCDVIYSTDCEDIEEDIKEEPEQGLTM